MRVRTLLLLAALAILGVSAKAQIYRHSGLQFQRINNNEVSVKADTANHLQGRLSIPSHITVEGNQLAVTEIADSAFFNCDSLTELHIPSTVNKFGKFVVDHCFDLTKITVDSDNKNFSSATGILFSADGKQLICCPAGLEVDSLIIPSEVNTIAPAAFSTCKGISVIVLPEGLKVIEPYTFQGCWGLYDVVFPESIETIRTYAFYRTILQFLFFPASLKEIESNAFLENSLVEVMCYGKTPAKLAADAWGVDMDYARVYVPAGTKGAYSKSTGWTTFHDIREGSITRRWREDLRNYNPKSGTLKPFVDKRYNEK